MILTSAPQPPASRLPLDRRAIGYRLIIIGLLIGALSLLWAWHTYAPWPPPERITGPAGQIRGALEVFKTRNGHYPGALTELVPFYLESLPQVGWGFGDWEYERTKGREPNYILELKLHPRTNSYEAYFYNSATGQWHLDT